MCGNAYAKHKWWKMEINKLTQIAPNRTLHVKGNIEIEEIITFFDKNEYIGSTKRTYPHPITIQLNNKEDKNVQ